MFIWKDEYNTGIESIDIQHRKLFSISNDIYALFKNEYCIDKYDKIVRLIHELTDYVNFHFNEEEEVLLKMRCRNFFAHKVEHDEFRHKIMNIDYSEIDKGQDEYIKALLNTVYDWITGHILEKDIPYTKEYLKNL